MAAKRVQQPSGVDAVQVVEVQDGIESSVYSSLVSGVGVHAGGRGFRYVIQVQVVEVQHGIESTEHENGARVHTPLWMVRNAVCMDHHTSARWLVQVMACASNSLSK